MKEKLGLKKDFVIAVLSCEIEFLSRCFEEEEKKQSIKQSTHDHSCKERDFDGLSFLCQL